MVANQHAAIALAGSKGGRSFSVAAYGRLVVTLARLQRGARLGLVGALGLALASTPAFAASNKVRVTNLSDLNFGLIANLSTDAIRAESVCLFAATDTNGYNITASGTGPAGDFELASGSTSLSYEVEWSSSAGQLSGAQLQPNVPLTGQVSVAGQQTCNNGPATSASLVIILRSAALSSATAGTYNGILTLVVGPE